MAVVRRRRVICPCRVDITLVQTLRKLRDFTSSLKQEKQSSVPLPAPVEPAVSESYHGQVMERDSDHEDEDPTAWHLGKLKFKKHIDDQYRNGTAGDGRNSDDYVVIDTRKR